MSRLALYFLGTPRIELNGESVSFSHHKAMALLAYLAITRQRHTRSGLAALLWPDYDSAGARGELRRMLWVLNKSLGQGWLEVDRETVLLPPQPDLWLDIECFRELLATGHQHPHPVNAGCPTCVAALTQAVTLAQGDFLAGFALSDSPEFDTWQGLETENLQRELAGALERLVQLLIRPGEASFEEAIIYARRWLALDPLHEPAQRQLMQLYAWSGQRTAALRQYQNLVRLLDEELGVSPDEETEALHRAIEENSLLAPPIQPERQAAKEHEASTSPSPLLSSPSAPPHNLPVQATPFIGREDTLNGLQQRLIDPAVQLMTIVEPGGIGKTRLALALAKRQLQRPTPFSDGVYFVSLAPISAAESLAQTIAEGVDFPLASAQEPTSQLLTYLRHKQMLLVLDNFEHLLAGATLVSQILQTAAGVKVLVTSRERLNLVNEMLWPISGLNFSTLTEVETAQTDDAVQLFMQRARRVRPDFALRPDDLPHLRRILQGVWGMPLAIELATAWLNLLPLAEIAAELSHGLDLLEGELRDVPDRHRSMRLVFDRSWERLETEEQALFSALAIFKGGFTREAARQITGASLRGLAGLVNKSLLASQPDTGRYELHELLRQYAEEKLEINPATKQAIQQAHAGYYANFMQQHWLDLRSSNQLAAVAAIERDIENIRAAWRFHLSAKNSAELLKFMNSFWFIYEMRGWYQAGIALFEEAIAAMPQDEGDETARLVRAKALGYVGFYTGIIGKPEQGAALSTKALELVRPLDPPEVRVYILYSLALSYFYLTHYEQVLTAAQEVRRVGQEIGDQWVADRAFSYITSGLVGRHKLLEAQQVSSQALQRFSQDIGDYFGFVWAALVRGQVALSQGHYAEARPFYERSLKAAQTLNYRRPTQQSYDNLGDIAFYLGELDQAEKYFRLSLEISEETGQTREMLGTLYDVARVWAAQGKQTEALQLLAVVLHHPLRNLASLLRNERTILSEAAERLRVDLEADLEPERYQAAWAQGRARQLEAVVAGLLRQA